MSIKSLTLGWCIAVILLAFVCWSQQSEKSPSENHKQNIDRTTSGLTLGLTSGLTTRG